MDKTCVESLPCDCGADPEASRRPLAFHCDLFPSSRDARQRAPKGSAAEGLCVRMVKIRPEPPLMTDNRDEPELPEGLIETLRDEGKGGKRVTIASDGGIGHQDGSFKVCPMLSSGHKFWTNTELTAFKARFTLCLA